MDVTTAFAIVVIGMIFVLTIGIALFVVRWIRKVEQGRALIINKRNSVVVTFQGGVVIPIIHKAEYMDISVKAIDVDRQGKEGLICQDNIRADIRVTFYVRVNATEEDVLKVAQSVGCVRASTKATLEELFLAKFSEALKTVGKQMEFTELFTERDKFKEQIIEVIGEDLNGYKLEDVAIDYLEQTPLESLDKHNILDAQGIRKIVDLTSKEAIDTNEFHRNRERTIKAQDVETREKMLELERQQADAEAKQKKEIESLQAREWSEAEQVKAEERLKAEQARIRTDEELAVAEENKLRQVEVAQKNRERTIGVEAERVVRDRDLEATERERLVAIKQIEKDKAVEVEKKKIAEVTRERVAIDKTVAEEQEKIKDTVAHAGAERERQVQVIEAEREAEKERVRITVEAGAKEEAAKSLYEEHVTMAEAQLIEAQKEAEAKKVLADARIVEESATGLADVKVREAEANAIVVQGEAEAAAATARYKAEAEGTEVTGKAEAAAMTAKFHADANGINEKAEAMKNFDGVGREHEEFKLELDKTKQIELAQIDVHRQIAEAQAKILGQAMQTANIDIVGGGDDFLRTFFKSISLAKSIDGFIDHSDTAKALTNGRSREEVAQEIKSLVKAAGMNAESLKDLTVSALLAKLALQGGRDGERAADLQDAVKELGLDGLAALWLAK